MNIKYLLGKIFTIPLLPILYYQGKKIRASVPRLPEAKLPQGNVDNSSEKSLRLLLLGESTIAGVGVDYHKEGFSGALATYLGESLDCNVKWKVYAKSGYTARQIVNNIVDKITENKADLIVIGLGGNDAFTLNSPGRWGNDIQALLKKVRKRFSNTPVVFTNMPPIKEFPAFTFLIKLVVGNLVEMHGEELKKRISSEDNVFYSSEVITIDGWLRKFNIDEKDHEFFSDGVHPSKFTYKVWANDVSQFIVENVKLNV